MTTSMSFSPHDDLVESSVRSAESENIQEAFTVMFMTIDHYLAECISAKTSLTSMEKRGTERVVAYCGLFSTELIKVTNETTFVLSAPEIYYVKTIFLLFDTSWSGKGCPKYGMKWEEGNGKSKVYCGKRHPWLEYSDGNFVKLRVYGLQVYLDFLGFDFHIFYSICRVCEMKKTRPTTVTVYNILYSTPVNAVSDANSIWHIYCTPGNEVRVVVHYDLEDYLNFLDIYVGPGPKADKRLPSNYFYSNNFMFLQNNISRFESIFDTNTNHAYIVNSVIDSNISLVFRYGIIYEYNFKNCRQKFPFRTQQVKSSPTKIYVTADGKRNVQCHYSYETNINVEFGERFYISLEILHFDFQGPTIVSEYSDQPCHYGGIFFYSLYDEHLPPYSLCNAKGEYIPQILALPSNEVYFVFQWFKGYSSGSLSAILHVTQCIINHMTPQNNVFSWPASLACQQFQFSWQNFLGANGSSYSLNITSASDVLLGPSTLSYSLLNTRLLLTDEISNAFQIVAQTFTTWPATDIINHLVMKHHNNINQSMSAYINFLANITVKVFILEVKSAWHITLKVSRSLCNGIMENTVESENILITEGCTMDHPISSNNTVTLIHAPLNHQLTYITLERHKGCEGIYVTKDEVIPLRDIHRHVYMRYTNIKERVIFRHEISQSMLTLKFNLTSQKNCTHFI